MQCSEEWEEKGKAEWEEKGKAEWNRQIWKLTNDDCAGSH